MAYNPVARRKAYVIRKARTNNASTVLQHAVSSGEVDAKPCEICGSADAEAHHDDYNKPLDVRWFCKPHHVDWHKSNKPIYVTGYDDWLTENPIERLPPAGGRPRESDDGDERSIRISVNVTAAELAEIDTVSEAPGGSAALIFVGGDSLLVRESLADLTALLGAKSVPVKMEVSGV